MCCCSAVVVVDDDVGNTTAVDGDVVGVGVGLEMRAEEACGDGREDRDKIERLGYEKLEQFQSSVFNFRP